MSVTNPARQVPPSPPPTSRRCPCEGGTAPPRHRATRLPLLLVTLVLTGCATQAPPHNSVNALLTRAPDVPGPLEAGAERPPSARTLYSLARILAAQGRDDECERVLLGIVRQEPRFAPAYSDLAELYVRRNRLDDAVRTLTSGLDRAPDDPVLLNNLGMCQVLGRDYAKAHELFSRATALAPNEQTYIANDAMALGMLGRVGEAAAAYARVLDSPEEVRENLALLRQAREHARVGGAGRVGPGGDPPVVRGGPTAPTPPRTSSRPSAPAPPVPTHEPPTAGPAAAAR